jgi:glucosylceramidase
VFVNPAKTFQTYLGLVAQWMQVLLFCKIDQRNQQEFLDAYYDKEKGIGYSIIRTTIHSSDFSSGSYTYIEEGDAALKTFNISHDRVQDSVN